MIQHKLWKPADLLYELVIEKPEDIDIDAIAHHCGARVKYADLTGCAAKIVGYGDRAIITVDKNSTVQRRRFSIGHELGHWMHDRGEVAFQCKERSFFEEWTLNSPEVRANRFASELLLPENLFRPLAEVGPISFSVVKQLAKLFKASTSATAIRFTELSSELVVLCACRRGRRTWFTRSQELSEKLFPLETPGSDTFTQGLLNRTETRPRFVAADQWFDYPGVKGSYLFEDAYVVDSASQETLTLLWWRDSKAVKPRFDDDDRWYDDEDDD